MRAGSRRVFDGVEHFAALEIPSRVFLCSFNQPINAANAALMREISNNMLFYATGKHQASRALTARLNPRRACCFGGRSTTFIFAGIL